MGDENVRINFVGARVDVTSDWYLVYREVSSIWSCVHFFKKMRFCYFCRSWIKINIIFGLICKGNVVGAISAGILFACCGNSLFS